MLTRVLSHNCCLLADGAFNMVRAMYSDHESVSDVRGGVTFFLAAPGAPRSAANATASLVGRKN